MPGFRSPLLRDVRCGASRCCGCRSPAALRFIADAHGTSECSAEHGCGSGRSRAKQRVRTRTARRPGGCELSGLCGGRYTTHGHCHADSHRRRHANGERYAHGHWHGHEHSYADLDAGADVDAGADLDAAAHLDAGWTANIHAYDAANGYEHTD